RHLNDLMILNAQGDVRTIGVIVRDSDLRRQCLPLLVVASSNCDGNLNGRCAFNEGVLVPRYRESVLVFATPMSDAPKIRHSLSLSISHRTSGLTPPLPSHELFGGSRLKRPALILLLLLSVARGGVIL